MGLFHRKTFIISSSEGYRLALIYEAGLGTKCYIPERDAKSRNVDAQQMECWWAMLFSKKTVIAILDNFIGSYFWMGVAFAMRKKCEVLSPEMFNVEGKKFDA